MLATLEKQHPEHVVRVKECDLKILPIAAIYGGNASGKSNLIKALRFAQEFVTNPSKPDAPISVRPFRLSSKSPLETSFRFELLIENSIYVYSFSVNAKKVLHEELIRYQDNKEELLFRRKEGLLDPPDRFPENSAHYFAFHGTQSNQLFLANSVSQKLNDYKPVLDWFEDGLTLISPSSFYTDLPGLMSRSRSQIERRLRDLDSGILGFRESNMPLEAVPKEVLDRVAEDIKDGQVFEISHSEGERLFLQKKEGRLTMRKFSPIHKREDGKEVFFSLADESDGTRRVLDLLPAFLSLESKKRISVFAIDELDRSLHSLLTRDLLEHYLAQCGPSRRSQLIFTTHDLHLMTQDLFRRDEIWVVERDRSGASKLVAFSEYKDVRRDKDIRKSYLQGRMGGIPRIVRQSVPCEDEATK